MNDFSSFNDPFGKRHSRLPVITLLLLSLVSGAVAIASGVSVVQGAAGETLIFCVLFAAICVTAITLFIIGVRQRLHR